MPQVRIETESARDTGRESVLVTGNNTRVSGNADRAFDGAWQKEYIYLGDKLVTLAVNPDTDHDGIPDRQDNCTQVYNPDQRDTDHDGHGNLCDADLNNDGATNTLDLNLFKLANGSKLGDPNYTPDADFNNDGVINSLDLAILQGLYRKPPGPSNVPTPEQLTYYHLDALGSPVAGTDAQGNIAWKETYQPYGERIQKSPAAISNPRWYTGHPQDPETGLVYAGARYYDPVIGRFMGVDPKNFSPDNLHSFNRYSYGNNNPYKYVDPDGRDNIAVVTDSRVSTPSDLSSWRGQYTVHGYTVYHVPNGTPVWAAPAIGRLFGEKVGSFEISWDAKSANSGNRGTVLGDSSRTAEVSLGGGRHPIHVTDVGGAKEDVLTQESGGNTISRSNIRLHSGGPYGSEGCGATCDARSKRDTERSLISNMPALSSPGERTLIELPAQGR